MTEHVGAAAATYTRGTGSTDGAFRVLEENLPTLMLEVERLGRRAQRLGISPPVLRDTGRREGRHAVVMLEGEPPTLIGWTLAAIVDHGDDQPEILGRGFGRAAP